MKTKRINNGNEEERELREIMIFHPNWFIKWGMTLFALVLSSLIFYSNFITIPQIIKSEYSVFYQSPLDSGRTNEIKCRLLINNTDKFKNKTDKKIELDVKLKNSDIIYEIEVSMDTLYYNPKFDKYCLITTLHNNYVSNLDKEFKLNDTVKGDITIILNKKSMFEKIFGRYLSFNNSN